MKISQFVNPALFSDKPDMVPTRDGFGKGLKELGDTNPQVVAVCADLVESTRVQEFADAYPHRFIELGVAEQNMSGVASGLAAMGKIPFMASYAMFSPGRNWEQIRTTIVYNEQNVKIVGAHAGVSVGPDGATHQAIEDIAIMRVLPGMVVFAPCDVHEARKATLAAAAHDGPVYIRLGREKTHVVTTPDAPFMIGEAQILLQRSEEHTKKVGIIACGTLVGNALIAAKELNEKHAIGASVMNLPTIKPLDEGAVLEFAAEHETIITLEEHQIAGGMGSVIAEYLSGKHPTYVYRMGVDDEFGQSGEPAELVEFYGMGVKSIIEAAQTILE